MKNLKYQRNMEVSALGKRIKYLLDESEFRSVRSFEKFADVSDASVRRVITGINKTMSSENLEKVAKALKVSIADLLNIENSYDISIQRVASDAISPFWFRVTTDEMQPTFYIGNFLLIDGGINRIKESAVYAIGPDRENAQIRRVTYNPISKKAILDVDNKFYKFSDEISPDDSHIQGKVIGVLSRL